MRKEPVIPLKTLIDEAVDHFGVKGKIKIVDQEPKDSGLICLKEIRFSKGKVKLVAPLNIANIDFHQNNRPHSLRRLVRDRFGKALHHLISHGARFKADPTPADAEAA